MKDVISSLQYVTLPQAETTTTSPLPEATSIEDLLVLNVPNVVPLIATGSEAPELEAAGALEAIAAAVGTTSEVGTRQAKS